MNIRSKTQIVLGATFLLVVAAACVASHTILMDDFVRLDEERLRTSVQRAKSALDSELFQPESVNRDWVFWDDTYEFILNRNEDYIRINLVDDVFRNLRLNFMVFVNSIGKVVYSKAYDLRKEMAVTLPDSLHQHLSSAEALDFLHPEPSSSVAGILLLPEGPMLVAANPILTSEGEGPIRGTLIWGRYLDETLIDALAERTLLSLGIIGFTEGESLPNLEKARPQLLEDAIYVSPLSHESIGGYSLIRDIYGKPALILKVDMPRENYQQGLATIGRFLIIIFLVSLLFGACAYLLIDRLVLSRLVKLSGAVRNVGKKSFSARVSLPGKDELSRLADTINTTLGELEAYQRALVDSERKYSTLVGKCGDGIIVIQDGLVKFANQRIKEIAGFSPEEITGKPFLTFVAPEHREAVAEDCKSRVTREKVPGRYEIEVLAKDGRKIPVEISVSRIEYEGRLADLALVRDMTERKQAEEALRRSEENFRRSMDDSPLGIRIVSADGELLYANKAILELYGYTSFEELRDTPRKLRYTPEAYAEHLARVEKRRRGEYVPSSYEISIVRKDGEIRHLEVSRKEVMWNGKTQFQVLYRDITGRRRAQARIQHLTNMLNALRGINQVITRENDVQRLTQRACEILIESRSYSIVLIVLVDEKGNFIFAARAGSVSSEEAWSTFLEGLKRGHYPRCLSEALERQLFAVLELDAAECRDCEFAYERVANTAFVERLQYEGKVYGAVLARIAAEFAHDEEERRLFHELVADVAFALDRIERDKEHRRLQEKLRESEERYRVILELGDRIGEAVVMLQDDERGEAMHVFASDMWCKITGYSREELLGMSMAALIHPRDRKAAMDRHRRRIRGEVLPGLYESTIVRKDGEEVPVEVTYAPASYRGKPANVGYIRDISERKKMQQQLIMQDRLASIGQLTSGVAHELNNPLTSIIGFSDLLLEKELPDDIKQDLETINREAHRTANIVRNLLTFARKQPQEKRPMDINGSIQRVLELRAYEQRVNNIQVITHFAPDLPRIMGNDSELQQVFFNIVINAEFFMIEAHARGTLTVTTERMGDYVRASFTDDGPGISEENMRHLFNPFFTTKEVGKGTGLGLSISQGIIAEHGGRIWAESEPGKGATFIIELPVYMESPQEGDSR